MILLFFRLGRRVGGALQVAIGEREDRQDEEDLDGSGRSGGNVALVDGRLLGLLEEKDCSSAFWTAGAVKASRRTGWRSRGNQALKETMRQQLYAQAGHGIVRHEK